MAIDLYDILAVYANKNKSPCIEINPFIDFLGKYAQKMAPEHTEWEQWYPATGAKFRAALVPLVKEEKCILLDSDGEERLFMPGYYIDMLKIAYQNPDASANLPFPCEESLNVQLKDDLIRSVVLDMNLRDYLEHPQDKPLPFIKLVFPDDMGSALCLAEMAPRKLMETAMLKVRGYLRRQTNKEYAQNKLRVQLQGKEQFLKDMLNQILLRPFDCIAALEGGGDFACLFWSHFCMLIKNDIKKKKELLSEDIAAMQSVYLIEAMSGFYKAQALKNREIELAFRELALHLDKAPFYFSMEDILQFTSNKGTPLLGQYSREELDQWLKRETAESKEEALPELLILQGPHGERWYIRKGKLLPLCARLLAEGRVKIREAVSKRWQQVIRNYRREPAMDTDQDFERLLAEYLGKLCPMLHVMLRDPRLLLVYRELEKSQGEIPSASRIFNRDVLMPYSALLLIKRRELLMDVRLLLPFWYSLPVFTSILVFFKKLFNPRKSAGRENRAAESGEEAALKNPAGEMRQAAKTLEAGLVPPGQTLAGYMEELENRWNRLINKQARADLLEDVNSLVRDNLRQILRVRRRSKLTREDLRQMAEMIIARSPALSGIAGQDSLRLYIELYLIKLLQNINIRL